jgi:hypothetical protein
VAVYFLFTATNTVGLVEQTGTASVVSRAYREAGTTYTTEVVAGRSYTRPQATPEAYLLRLMLDGREATAQVDQVLFEAAEAGDQVQVTYQKRRLTGATQIVRVSR